MKMKNHENAYLLQSGKISVGIEVGSTRIKTVAITPDCHTIATGSFEWENRFEAGYWTYHLDEMWKGIQESYGQMTRYIEQKYNVTMTQIASLGISGMMHGYLVFDDKGNLLVPFRTWRNNNATEAAVALREKFEVNIPERWSIAQLYQSILNQDSHVDHISFMTTLSGYIHWRLTGEKVLGIGDASGMFPVDSVTQFYRQDLCEVFDELLENHGYSHRIESILPKVNVAGQNSGELTTQGARLIDPTGKLHSGCPLCPPEGDAQSGMVATNSVAPHTGNVSVGTSIFAMIVLDKPLCHVYPEVDIVTTPSGHEVAMIHANNGTSDINSWMGLFGEVLTAMGINFNQETLFTTVLERALDENADVSQWLSYGYVSGEFITEVSTGYPMLVRTRDGQLTLAHLMKTHLFSTMSTLKIGIDLLQRNEDIRIDSIVGHGGLFKTPQVAQKYLAMALESPVRVMDTASEGGAWGMAVLANYSLHSHEQEFETYLKQRVFQQRPSTEYTPLPEDILQFREYVAKFEAGLQLQEMAHQTFSKNTKN